MRYMNRRNIFTYEQNGCKVQKHKKQTRPDNTLCSIEYVNMSNYKQTSLAL